MRAVKFAAVLPMIGVAALTSGCGSHVSVAAPAAATTSASATPISASTTPTSAPASDDAGPGVVRRTILASAGASPLSHDEVVTLARDAAERCVASTGPACGPIATLPAATLEATLPPDEEKRANMTWDTLRRVGSAYEVQIEEGQYTLVGEEKPGDLEAEEKALNGDTGWGPLFVMSPSKILVSTGRDVGKVLVDVVAGRAPANADVAARVVVPVRTRLWLQNLLSWAASDTVFTATRPGPHRIELVRAVPAKPSAPEHHTLYISPVT